MVTTTTKSVDDDQSDSDDDDQSGTDPKTRDQLRQPRLRGGLGPPPPGGSGSVAAAEAAGVPSRCRPAFHDRQRRCSFPPAAEHHLCSTPSRASAPLARTTAGAADHSAGYRRATGPRAWRRRRGPAPRAPSLPSAPRGVTAEPPAGREPLPAHVGSNVKLPPSSYRIGYTELFAECRVVPGSGLGSARRCGHPCTHRRRGIGWISPGEGRAMRYTQAVPHGL